MKPFINIIQFIADKHNLNLPDNFLIYFDNFFYNDTKLSDVKIYKCYIYINENTYSKEEAAMLKDIYIKAKNLKNVLKTYIRKRKISKMNIFDNNMDLYFNPLNKYPKIQLTNLIINNTIYKFRISNLINMWLDSLTKQENLFCKPIILKNPYTNLPFEKHNLYNLFFAIYFSPYIIPTLIYNFFLVNFNVDLFIFKYYPILKDYAIKNFISNGSVSELYENIHNMLHSFKHHLGGIYLPNRLAYSRKKFIVKELTPYLKDYLISEYCCNPFKKRIAYNKSKEGLSIYFRENELIYVRRDTEDEDEDDNNITNYVPPPPITIENTTPPPPTLPVTSPRIGNRRENIINLLEINRTLRRNIADITQLAEREVFTPQRELPRSPNRQQTQNVRPFSLNLFSSRLG
tara:strand:- start:1509 stop:2717 length:1209 start_codon:yes stop_codon:yes gene_type:complete